MRTDSNGVITEITIEEAHELADRLEAQLGKEGLIRYGLILQASVNDSPEGFKAFFELLHGPPLHSEGELWIKKAYEAHESGKGLAQKCHRESGKTTVFSKFFTAFRIGKEPHKTNGIIRNNDDKANLTAAAIAHIIEHDPNWRAVFPHVVPDKERGWGAKGYYVKRTDIDEDEWKELCTQSPPDPTFVGYGRTSGSIIGSRFSGVCIVDDIIDTEDIASERTLAKVRDFYTNTLQYCLMTGSWEVWNYTPWLSNDIYAYIESTGEYLRNETPVMRPAEPNAEGAQYWEEDPHIPYSGRWWYLYWPEVWDFKRIAKKYRTTGALDFARMMLLDLEATKGINLKKEWLHYYPADEIDPTWPVFFGVDYASTRDKLKDKNRDYFALAIMRAIPGGGLVLVDGDRRRLSKGEAITLVLQRWQQYPTLQLIGVESIGKGEEFYNDLIFANDIAGRPPPLFEIRSHGRRSKGARFEDWLAPRFQMSRIWVSNASSSFINEFVNEWLLWPNAEFDDCLDGVYMAALAGEGFMPAAAERTFNRRRKRKSNKIWSALAQA